jgi:hypothetical protein
MIVAPVRRTPLHLNTHEIQTMERRPPKPVCKCFVACRQIFVDAIRQDYALVSVVHQLFPQRFPVVEDLSIFARWSNAHGSYTVEVQLRSLEGDVLWRQEMERPFEAFDPLRVTLISLNHLTIPIARPGKYEVALLANGEEVAADVLLVHPPQKASAG